MRNARSRHDADKRKALDLIRTAAPLRRPWPKGSSILAKSSFFRKAAEAPPPAAPAKISKSRPGAVLVLAILMMGMICLTGTALLVTSMTQVRTGGQNRAAQEAFENAESAAFAALYLTRLLIFFTDPPESFLASPNNSKDAWIITINEDRFTIEEINPGQARFDFESRYQEAVNWGGPGPKPHLIFKKGDRVVAAASIRLENDSKIGSGYPLTIGDAYDPANGNAYELNIVITVYGGPFKETGKTLEGPKTIITTVFREYI